MIKLSRILVPVEFSPRCYGAVQYAEALAARFGSDIVLLHVISPPKASYNNLEAMACTDPDEIARDMFRASSKELEKFPCDAPKSAAVRRLVMEGDPACVIVACAASEACDLIVIPTHGYGPFRRFLLGSVTAKVLHDSRCPVITGPHMEQQSDYKDISFRHVAAAFTLGPHSRDVLCYAGKFAGMLGAKLTVIHALPASTTCLGGFYFDPDWDSQLIRTAHDRIEFLLKDMGLQADIAIESGDPPGVVRTVAQKSGVDLVVVGRGSTPHAHGHLPSESYAIVRESPCAVMSL